MDTKRCKARQICTAKNCSNNNYLTNESFFPFPADVERAIKWCKACGRDDLVCKADTLHQGGRRICGAHFERSMFVSDLQNRLHQNAIPTIFSPLTCESQSENNHNYYPSIQNTTVPVEVKTDDQTIFNKVDHKVDILENILSQPASYSGHSEEVKLILEEDPLDTDVVIVEPDYLEPRRVTSGSTVRRNSSVIQKKKILSHASTQTSSRICGNVHKTSFLKDLLKKEQQKVQQLQKNIEKLEEALRKKNREKPITLEAYETITYKVCPDEQTAKVVVSLVSEAVEKRHLKKNLSQYILVVHNRENL